jgi:hypothetical protein
VRDLYLVVNSQSETDLLIGHLGWVAEAINSKTTWKLSDPISPTQ